MNWRGKKERLAVLVVVGSFLLGSFLRAWQYWAFPVAGETQDEVAWSLLGSSLLQTGQPVSWSYFKGYTVLKIVDQGFGEVKLVAPALDHPPLFSLLPGSILTILGKSWEAWPSMKVIRFPVVLLSLLNLGLFYYWLFRTNLASSGKVLAALIFTTAPSFVFLSRLVVSENLLVTWVLCIVIASNVKRRWKSWFWGLLLFVLPLTKISGGAIGAAVVGWLWMERDTRGKEFWWALAGLAGGFLGWMVYAAAFDISLFWHVQLQQSQRDTGFLTLFSSQFFAPTLVEKVFSDFWISLGWFAGFAWVAQQVIGAKISKTDRLILYLFLAQLAFIALSVGEHTVHGWYRIPFLPLFAYFFGALWQSIHDRRSWLGMAFSFLLISFVWRLGLWTVLGTEMYAWQNVLNRVWLLIAGAVAGVETLKVSARTERFIWGAVIGFVGVLLLITHGVIITSITQDTYWQDELYLEQGLRP